jgi:hypothetical protein
MNTRQGALIHEFMEPFRASDGVLYDVRVLGRQREDGTWVGWLEFDNPIAGKRKTDRETTQSNAEGLAYWASGLEPIYLEGAFDRAQQLAADVASPGGDSDLFPPR